MVPSVTSPSSTLSSPEIAFRVVVLPAPFAPKTATILSLFHLKDIPFSNQNDVIIYDFDVVDIEHGISLFGSHAKTRRFLATGSRKK